jgi:hypothetical protein
MGTCLSESWKRGGGKSGRGMSLAGGRRMADKRRSLTSSSCCQNSGGGNVIDNPNTTQTLEYTKDKYNVKIIK